MGSPFQPLSRKEPQPLRTPDHPPIVRLRRAGATDAQIVEAERRWAEMTDDEKRETLAALEHLTPEDWREMVAEDADTPAADTDVPDGSIENVLAWVNNDPELARRAYAAEAGRVPSRVTLNRALEAIIVSDDG